MKDPRPHEPVVVKWIDASHDAGTQFDSPQSALDAYRPAIRRSIGFWVGRSGEAVHIATDDDRSSEARSALGGVAAIPTGMVREIIPLCKVLAPKPRTRKR